MKYTEWDIDRLWCGVNKSGECWIWTLGKGRRGYGKISIGYKTITTHRMSWEIAYGEVTNPMLCVCHHCDNPPCVRPDHLFLGTQRDNIADRDAKGRTARGETSGPHMHPERMARGDKNGQRTHPERTARGLQNGKYTKPWRTARGDRNGSRTHPEKRPRGEKNTMAKLCEKDVREIRSIYATGQVSLAKLAERFGVHQTNLSSVIHRRTWKHVI